jgi:dipeptidyl aminopeptidase/acylaminoacyl peptidase
VRDLPDFAPAPELLEQARLGRKNELLRDARNAEVRLDWMTAERIYAGLAADDPDDPEIAAKLLAIRQERAVYLFTLRQRLYVANPINAEPVLVTDELKAAWPVWSPDRSKIAFVSPGDKQNGYIRALYVVDADGSNLRKLAEDPARWRPPLWTPDGKHIAFEVDGASVGDPTVRATVMVVDLATSVVTDIIGDAFPNGSSPAWSPDGDRLAFVVRGIDLLESEPGVPSEILRVDVSTIYVMTMATGEITPLGQGVVPEPWRINWSPTSEELLVFSRKDGSSFRKGALYRLNATTGAVERIARSNIDLSMPVWSPDGSRFAYTIETTTIRIVGSGGGAFDVQSPITVNGWLSWAPSSDRLLAMGQSGQAYSVLLEVDAASADLRVIELAYDSEGGDAGPPQWSSANPAAPPQVLTVSGTALDG